ncbi:electron transfer flavoprotein [Halobacteriales archaeon SW_6_65_46]|nr:MAG: electron transfer flavoprotein [Halobacteriales archaeon SW_6_65_46]
MSAESYDVVVVGGGTAGAFAAATVAREGLDAVVLERKSPDDAGAIACGDAIKGASTFPDVIDLDYLREESFSNEKITRARFLNPQGDDLDVDLDSGAVLDRKRFGEVLLEEADRAGAAVHYDTVVTDVRQNGAVHGVTAVKRGTPKKYDADIVIDAAGALSVLQDKASLGEATFDTNVNYQQFCSAYREIIETNDPVDYEDAIVFKPTAELGYLWYFPRSAREINVGVGFQMNKSPMKLVSALREDVRQRSEFDGATVRGKLGAALPTRRPYDSGTAPGYIAVGDAAAHVNPCTGGGIPGAAKAGHWAAEAAIEAIGEETTDEEAALWEYNHKVQTDFGGRFAAMDLYNIWGGEYNVDQIVNIISSLPGQQLVEAIGSKGTTSMSFGLKLKTVLNTFGHWGTLLELRKVNQIAADLRAVYKSYPTTPGEFDDWQTRRDSVMDEFHELTGAARKY